MRKISSTNHLSTALVHTVVVRGGGGERGGGRLGCCILIAVVVCGGAVGVCRRTLQPRCHHSARSVSRVCARSGTLESVVVRRPSKHSGTLKSVVVRRPLKHCGRPPARRGYRCDDDAGMGDLLPNAPAVMARGATSSSPPAPATRSAADCSARAQQTRCWSCPR